MPFAAECADNEVDDDNGETQLETPEHEDAMHVVDEQANIITVNAFEAKSADERKFINGIPTNTSALRLKRKRNCVRHTCDMCKQTFHNIRSLEEHIDFGLCHMLENQHRCTRCPLSYASTIELNLHLEMHKLNRFFCQKHCGKYYQTLEQCEAHEYTEHNVRPIACGICKHKFGCCNSLDQHMQQVHALLRRFVCSYCREWFTCSIDLAKHWQVTADGCGELMQGLVHETSNTIESTLAIGSKRQLQLFMQAKLAEMQNQVPQSVMPAVKRVKTAQQVDELQQPLYLSLSDVKIKDEPPEDSDIADDLQSLMTNATTSNETLQQVEIKAEPKEELEEPSLDELTEEDKEMKIKLAEAYAAALAASLEIKQETCEVATVPQNTIMVKVPINTSINVPIKTSISSPIITATSTLQNNVAATTTTTTPKLLPRSNLGGGYSKTQQVQLPPNMRLIRLSPIVAQNFSNVTATNSNRYLSSTNSINFTKSTLKPLQLKNQNVNTPHIKLPNYKVVRLIPNGKLLMPNLKMSTKTTAATTGSVTVTVTPQTQTPPVAKTVLKFKPSSTLPMRSVRLIHTDVVTSMAYDKNNKLPPSPPSVTLTLKSLGGSSTTIDAEDLKKLVNEASAVVSTSAAMHSPILHSKLTKVSPPGARKNLCRKRHELEEIERMPDKRALIADLKEQIKKHDGAVSLIDDAKGKNKMQQKSTIDELNEKEGTKEGTKEVLNETIKEVLKEDLMECIPAGVTVRIISGGVADKKEVVCANVKTDIAVPKVAPNEQLTAGTNAVKEVIKAAQYKADNDVQKITFKNALNNAENINNNNKVESNAELIEKGAIDFEAAIEQLDKCYDSFDDGAHNFVEDDDDEDVKPLIIDENQEFINDDIENKSQHSMSNFSDSYAATTTSSVDLGNTLSNTELDIPEPPTFYLPIATEEGDHDLATARRRWSPNYRFVWSCPQCSRQYVQKYAFRGHLVGAHGLCKEEFSKLIVEVLPVPCAKTLEDENNIKLQNSGGDGSNDSLTHNTNNNNPNEASTYNEVIAAKKLFKYTCAKCGRTCSTRTALNDHVLANCGRDPQYPCMTCSKHFYSVSTLNQHMSIHTGEMPHKCNYCEKRFRTRGQVTVHHRTHTGERPFECQVCGQRFTHRETLISHLSRHIGMKRYKCYGCNQQFACISGLKTHREVRFDSCGKVKLNTRAIGPRVRVIKGNVMFETQPEINPYLRTEDPEELMADVANNSV